MSHRFAFPTKGFVFWPVGTGDSSTIVVKDGEIIVQIDLHHMEKSEESQDTAWPIIDELVRLLPERDGQPYLSVFVLTHPDEDHIRGFGKLLDEVEIGEIWHTPRTFAEYKKDLCEDAKAFRKEAERRTKATIKNQEKTKTGDRIRIIGFDDILKEDAYKSFPKDRLSIPGKSITSLDAVDVSDYFEAFVHAPLKEDSESTRNNTSVSLHVTLKEDDTLAQALFFGDREYPTVKQIFEVTIEHKRQQYLEWDLLLTPHHCSKKVMYWKDVEDKDESFRKDIMDYFEKYRKSDAYLIASADAVFTDGEGDDPPHAKARKKYEKIVDAGHFICTHEWPTEEDPEPAKFELTGSGLALVEVDKSAVKAGSKLGGAVATVRGGPAPPQQQVGFGKKL